MDRLHLLLIVVLFNGITVFGALPPGHSASHLFGTVTDNYDRPVADVNVIAIPETAPQETVTVFSNRNGNYNLPLLKPGVYRLVFEKDGYKKLVKEKVTISRDASTKALNVEIILMPRFSERGPSVWHFFDS